MMQRSGEVVITMLPNVQQNTIAPLIQRTIAKGTVVYTDAYDIYGRLTEWQRFPEEPKHLQDKDLCVHYFAKKPRAWYAPNIRP